MQNLASRWARVISFADESSDDYTLIVPIFGDPKYFRNGDYLRKFRDRTLLAVNVDSPKMRRFVVELREQGWRVHASRLTGRVSCPEIVLDALRSVHTEYVIRIDGDTVDIGQELGTVLTGDVGSDAKQTTAADDTSGSRSSDSRVDSLTSPSTETAARA